MVALLAQREEIEDGMQLSPPGFHAVFLTFAEDVREHKTTDDDEVKREGMLLAASLVKYLSSCYGRLTSCWKWFLRG